MKTRIILIVATFTMLLGSLAAPVMLRADGTPDPSCMPKTVCKP